MNIINTLKSLDVKFLLFSHCGKQYLDHRVYKDTYADVIDKKEYWLDGDIDWAFLDWAKKKQVVNKHFKTCIQIRFILNQKLMKCLQMSY